MIQNITNAWSDAHVEKVRESYLHTLAAVGDTGGLVMFVPVLRS
jgi:hypothetical protein